MAMPYSLREAILDKLQTYAETKRLMNKNLEDQMIQSEMNKGF